MENQKNQKSVVGEVIGRKMDKTATVSVEQVSHHPLYHKTIRRVIRYQAHDEKNETGLGDTVRIIPVRPMSKSKRWKIVEIITKGEVAEIKPQEIA